jgi:hypothetical protein
MNASDDIKAELDRLLATANPRSDGQFFGRGIVICAGGTVFLTNAYVQVRLLRDRLACQLPIEIWHCGTDEMPQIMAEQFATHGCRIRDASDLPAEFSGDIRDGWQLKVHAIRHSAFEQVLLLDADQVPVRDPAIVFDWPQFAATGAVFWPDVVDLAAENPIWHLLGLPSRKVPSWESGQIVVDKAVHLRALTVVGWICARPQHFYELIYGDKDAFLLAWSIAGASCALVPHRPYQNRCYLGQRDFSGDLLFQHRSGCKWRLSEQPRRPEGFLYQDTCESYLNDLKMIWNGRHFVPPPRTASAREREALLAARREFVLNLGDDQPEPVELLSGHQIGRGRSHRITNWHVEATECGFRLWLHDLAKPAFRLDEAGGETWLGRSIAEPYESIALLPGTLASLVDAATCKGVADEIIDVALRSAPSDFDREGMLAALRLLTRIESGIDGKLRLRSRQMRDRCPQVAGWLEDIADEMAGLHQRFSETRRNVSLFFNPNHYRRD